MIDFRPILIMPAAVIAIHGSAKTLQSRQLAPTMPSSLQVAPPSVSMSAEPEEATGENAMDLSRVGDYWGGVPDHAVTQPRNSSLSFATLHQRKQRAERILATLERVSEVSMQMSPERAEWLAPILDDLAERTVLTASPEAMDNGEEDGVADAELRRIECSVRELTKVMSRMIEPEMVL